VLVANTVRTRTADRQQPFNTVGLVGRVERRVDKNALRRNVGARLVADDVDLVGVEKVLVSRKGIIPKGRAGEHVVQVALNVLIVRARAQVSLRVTVAQEYDVDAVRGMPVVVDRDRCGPGASAHRDDSHQDQGHPWSLDHDTFLFLSRIGTPQRGALIADSRSRVLTLEDDINKSQSPHAAGIAFAHGHIGRS
jgi:hypothetical protein